MSDTAIKLALQHPNVSSENLAKAADHWNPHVTKLVAHHNNFDAGVAERLFNSGEWNKMAYAINSKYSTPEMIQKSLEPHQDHRLREVAQKLTNK